MLRTNLLVIVVAIAVAFPSHASAEQQVQAVTTIDVNLRAGPGTGYPVVAVMPTHAAIVVHGCLEGYSWCDVTYGAQRGWVSASYTQIVYANRPVTITAVVAPQAGIGIVVFNRAYWDRYYVGRSWCGRWAVYAPTSVTRNVTCAPGTCNGTKVVSTPFRTITRNTQVNW